MRPKPDTPSSTRCALTARLRYRAQAAEAETARVRAKAEAAVAQARAEADAAHQRMAAMREAILAERAALTEFIESPEWERDLLLIARDRVRAELMDLSLTHKSCGQCGSFGRDFKAKFLQSAIDALTRDHDLPKADPLPPADWAVPMGSSFRQGRGLNASWHSQAPKTPPRRAAIW